MHACTCSPRPAHPNLSPTQRHGQKHLNQYSIYYVICPCFHYQPPRFFLILFFREKQEIGLYRPIKHDGDIRALLFISFFKGKRWKVGPRMDNPRHTAVLTRQSKTYCSINKTTPDTLQDNPRHTAVLIGQSQTHCSINRTIPDTLQYWQDNPRHTAV